FLASVLLHVLVIIEVVLREIGEYAGVEGNARDALLLEGMAADFHGDGRAAGVAGACKQDSEVFAEGGGVRGVDGFVADDVAERSESGGLAGAVPEDVANHEYGAGFPVGSGDTGDAHGFRGVAGQAVGKQAQGAAGMRYGDVGQSGPFGEV